MVSERLMTNLIVGFTAEPLGEATSLFAPNYKYYIFEGTEHILLNRPEFYTEKSGGLPLYRWLKAMVDNPLQANGLWQDYACPDCLSPCE